MKTNVDKHESVPAEPIIDNSEAIMTDLNFTTESCAVFVLNEVNRTEEDMKVNAILDQMYPDRQDFSLIMSDPGGYSQQATPLTPAKDGHWFIKTGYSQQKFRFDAQHPGFWGGYYKVHVQLARDADVYSRILKLFIDGTEFYSAVISSSGFHGDIQTPFIWWHGEHTITVQINYCGWVEHQWRLDYFWVYDEYGTPQDVNGEYFQAGISAPKNEYRIRGGTDTRLSITVKHAANPGTWGAAFTLKVYMDGAYKTSIAVPNGEWSFEVDLGDYSFDSLRTLKLTYTDSVVSPGYRIIVINQPHHDAGWVEVDYFSGHAPASSDLNYLESYYIVHGYNRADFFLSSAITGSDYTNYKNLDISSTSSSSDWGYLRNKYFANKGNTPKYEWCLFAHYLYANGQLWAGVLGAHWSSYLTGGIAIHDQLMMDYRSGWNPPSMSAYRRTVLMHEYGHHIDIIDRNSQGGEIYCSNIYCCMHAAFTVAGYNVNEAPWYCAHHWSQNDFPGW